MKRMIGLALTMGFMMAAGAQASASGLCSAEDQTKIMAKDRETIQRVAKQFYEMSLQQEKDIAAYQEALKARGFANAQEFSKALEKAGSRSQYADLLQMAGSNIALGFKIQEVRQCVQLAAKVLNIQN